MKDAEIRYHEHDAAVAAARNVEAVIAKALPDEPASTATAFVLAEVLKAQDSKNFEVRNFTLEHLINVYIGTALVARLVQYLALHERLEAGGAVSEQNRKTFFREGYSIYAIPAATHVLGSRHGTGYVDEVVVRAMVLQTREGDYLVVLNKRFGSWKVHFRRFWPVFKDALASDDWLVGLQEYRDSKNLTLEDVIKLSHAAMRYSDDVPGAEFPDRPSLETYLKGQLIAGEDGAGIGLRYGDNRDAGFIASLRESSQPVAQDADSGHLQDVHLVATLLHKAIHHKDET